MDPDHAKDAPNHYNRLQLDSCGSLGLSFMRVVLKSNFYRTFYINAQAMVLTK